MDHIENHNKIVASRDKNGVFRIRVDYLANKDVLNFYVEGDKLFTVSKQILHESINGITYVITMENKGNEAIDLPIVLYSGNGGVFTIHRMFKREIVGEQLKMKSLRARQKFRTIFLTKKISKKEDALRMIDELTTDTIYGKKILSVFERFNDELRNDKELFVEGVKHNPHVLNFASEALQQDAELLDLSASKINIIKTK